MVVYADTCVHELWCARMTGEGQPAFRVLGPLEIWDQGRRLEVRAPRQQAMLSILLLSANQVVDQDQLIETLWPGMPTPSATSILHSLVYRLRRFLDTHGAALGARLERSSYGYILHVVRDSVDLYRFERLVAEGRKALEGSDNEAAVARLRAGLELWRGEAFAGIDEPVVRQRASALNELRLDATEWCLRSELDLGQHEELVTELSRLTVEHPYRERFWELLMTALYRCGRQADALEAYQRLYRLLDEELGVQPGPAVQQLQQRILASEQELNVQPARPAARVPSVPRLLPARIRDFTGRANALRALDALLLDDGEPDAPAAIAIVTGTGGIGKTAFAVHWAHLAAERYENALGPCEQALALQQEAGDRFHEAHTLDSIGYIHQHRGSYACAVEYYRQAIELFQLNGESYWLANTLTNLGDTLRTDAGPPAGCQEWKRALDILTELDHPDAEGLRARLAA